MTLTQEARQQLIESASRARKFAYVPYSKYPVGAALITQSGKVYTGCNIENAAFPVTNCAERTAVFKAVSEGERKFQALALVTENGGSPCGACRQVLAEFGLDTVIYICNGKGEILQELTVAELLPQAFTPEHLDTR
jgi:cytidine deaminase